MKFKKGLSKISKTIINYFTMNPVIGDYNIDEIYHQKELNIDENITDKEIENFILIPNNTTIVFRNMRIPTNDKKYFQRLINIINKLEKHNRKYYIKLYINNRQEFIQSGLINQIKNIDLTLNYLFCDYTKEEFLQEEAYLDQLIKPIKESNLSPYEKYLAIYNIVKNYKPYKDNPVNPKESRCIKYILHNEYMVCVGFAALLEILLNKVGIPTIRTYIDVDITNENPSLESQSVGHQRNIVKIDDNKYNIHGIYIADSTYDNHEHKDLYLHSGMTFDRTKESKYLEYINNHDLLLDFHTFFEFKNKINYFLKRKIQNSSKQKYNDKIIYSYIYLYCHILDILCHLDYDKYIYFINKYENPISKLHKTKSHISSIEKIFSDFLTEYYNYIIKLTNKKIDPSITYKALRNIKKTIYHADEEKIAAWEYIAKKTNQKIESKVFPYRYNHKQEIPNYLQDVEILPLKKQLKRN